MTDSPDLSRVLEDVRLLASRAVESERNRRLELAAHLYRETARLIQSALQRGADKPGQSIVNNSQYNSQWLMINRPG